MKSYMISNEFTELNEFIYSLPHQFDQLGFVIKDNRNVIKKVNSSKGELVIKSFKGMYFFNRIAYSFFRKSKAERSYLNAAKLNQKGIDTPLNVGWLDKYSGKLLEKSYYLSLYSPHKTFAEHLVDRGDDEESKKKLYGHLVNFVMKLHQAGVMHMDLSLGNILVIPSGNDYKFSMVDLNRVRFRTVRFKDGLNNLRKIEIPEEDMNNLVRRYAELNGESPENAVNLFWAMSRRFIFLRGLRKKLRRYTLTPVEKLTKKLFIYIKESDKYFSLLMLSCSIANYEYIFEI